MRDLGLPARLAICLLVVGFGSFEAGIVRRVRAQARERCSAVAHVRVSVSRFPHVWRHVLDARAGNNTSRGRIVVSDGLRWPRVLVKDSVGEAGRRAAAFRAAGVPTRKGFDRDEYPPAVGRRTVLADIRYVPSSENRSQGASMGNQLRDVCDGQRFVLVSAP